MEYNRLYKCDICGDTGATHYEIPDVDAIPDSTGYGAATIPSGNVDLCSIHSSKLISAALVVFQNNMYSRRRYWKEILGGHIV